MISRSTIVSSILSYILVMTLISMTSCNTTGDDTNDPFGCDSRAPFVMADTIYKNGVVGEIYSEPIRRFAEVELLDSVNAESIGLMLARDSSTMLYYIKGTPKKSTDSNYFLKFRVATYGTQCMGQESEYRIFIKIN